MVAALTSSAPSAAFWAILLAVVAALIFGIAAVVQHRAVRETVDPGGRRLSGSHLRTLVADRGWLWGLGLMVVGTLLHVGALTLAPISLTQPIGVLAVPTTIVLTAVLAHRRPPMAAVVGALLVIAGVVAIVASMSTSPGKGLPPTRALVEVGLLVLVLNVVLHLVAHQLTRPRIVRHQAVPTWWAGVLLGAVSAIDFGVASSILRLLLQHFVDSRGSLSWTTGLLALALVITLLVGAWSIQQAYAAGAAPAVTATSTLVDPAVAIALGILVLGEGQALGAARVSVLVVGAVVAMAGVIQLARHEEDVIAPTRPNPARGTGTPPAGADPAGGAAEPSANSGRTSP